ncbi:MAG: hypothetical protein DRP54_07240 [Spirochaetes bacterium]|nr:MAG: hypothetical protein DRP54_07240 [Spirochaetota bacterium]
MGKEKLKRLEKTFKLKFKFTFILPVLLLCIFLIISSCTITNENQIRFYALIIGINNYADTNVPDLDYCVSDAVEMKDALINQGWNESDTVILLDSQASKTNIIQNLNDIFSKASSSDFILVYYSGHGTVIPDTNGDENDGEDEAIVPWDFTYGDYSTLLLDDELGEIFQECPTDKGAIIFDSCNSGGFINKSIRDKGINPKTLTTGSKNPGLNGDLDITSFPVLTASSQDEYSYEIGGEISHGVFTYFILEGMNHGYADSNGDGLISIKEVFSYSKENTIELTENYPSITQTQHPQILFHKSFVDITITR